jgi:phage shock protein A
MEARAQAMDELQEEGVLENQISDKSSLDRELEEMRQGGEVDAELETLKSEMGKSDAEPTEDTADETELEAELEDETVQSVDDSEVEAELDELKESERTGPGPTSPSSGVIGASARASADGGKSAGKRPSNVTKVRVLFAGVGIHLLP